MRAKIVGGSDMSAGGTLFREIQRPFRWVPDVRWRDHYFARNKEAFPGVRPWTQLSDSPHSLFPMVSFVDHVYHAAPSASKMVDDGEAPDSNEPTMGRRESRVADGEVYKVNWF